MTNTPKSPTTRDPLTTSKKEGEFELREQELSRVTGGANWLHLEVPDTYIFIGPVHK